MQGKIALEEHFAPREGFDERLKYFGSRLPAWPEIVRRQVGMFDVGLAEMDASGVERTVVSLGAPAVQAIVDPRDAIDVARRCNDLLRSQIDRHPERFSGFAALPMQDPEAAVAELERCVRELGFVGALVNGFTQLGSEDSALYYDLPRFDPVWAACERLDVPFYLHPRNPMATQLRIYEGHPWLQGSAWAFGVETSTHALRMMAGGVFDRFPKLKVLLGHLGEGLPGSIWRVDHRVKKGGEKIPAKQPLAHYLRTNFWLTTSGNFHDSTLAQAITEVGAGRILFSADYPFEDFREAAEWFDRAPLDDAARRAIGRENARSLLRLP